MRVLSTLVRTAARRAALARPSPISCRSAWSTVTATRAACAKATDEEAGSALPRPDLRKLADLAKVSLTEEQIEDFQPKVDRVVDWFAQLQEVDLEESEIQDFEVVDSAGRAELREDVPRVFGEREALLSQIPNMEGKFIKLPKTTTEG